MQWDSRRAALFLRVRILRGGRANPCECGLFVFEKMRLHTGPEEVVVQRYLGAQGVHVLLELEAVDTLVAESVRARRRRSSAPRVRCRSCCQCVCPAATAEDARHRRHAHAQDLRLLLSDMLKLAQRGHLAGRDGRGFP